MLKFGVLMDLPEGKRAGYYAQIVKALADAVEVFDRDKELIVVDDAEAARRTAEVLEKYRVGWEPMRLWLLPEGAALPASAAEYGFESKFGNAYLYADRVALFRVPNEQEAGAELAPALLQIEEFVLLVYVEGATKTYACEPHLRETVEGVARRYRVAVQFIL
ncbi:hypothetical protein [Paenibacillus sp.]|uniref:hypothetical protein n=1 Tax=Paenibacillus sp. TaxID=58172 RepID=UPI002D3EF0C3|nr:hypothetical protein [Paenibacillus sp.]HZG55894.1 hypothetical protein [Paenibacillus sp.]